MLARRVLILNVFLLSAVLVCAQQLKSAWQQYEEEMSVERLVAASLGPVRDLVRTEAPWTAEENLEHDFTVISERDLFSPDRRPESDAEEEEAPQEAPEFPKRPEMNGTTTVGGTRKALIVTFATAKAKGESRMVGLQDTVQGWLVSAISDTTLTLSWNDQEEIIDMLDARLSQQAKPAAGKVAAVKVVRIGSKYAAVETTSPEQADEDERRGLQVGVVGNVGQGVRGGSAAGLRGGSRGLAGTAAGRMGTQGQMGTTSQGRSASSMIGGLSGRTRPQ